MKVLLSILKVLVSNLKVAYTEYQHFKRFSSLYYKKSLIILPKITTKFYPLQPKYIPQIRKK